MKILSMDQSDFFRFVVERQRIWYNRFILKKKPPWTNDKILQKYRFTNVYRELDKGTIYIIKKLEPYKKDRATILFNTIAYRLFNRVGFFEDVEGLLNPYDYNVEKFIERLDNVKKIKPLFSNAYIIPSDIVNPNVRPNDKHVQIAFLLEKISKNIDDLLDKIDSSQTPLESYNILKKYPFLKNFISYEVWTDLTYFNFFKQGWTDDDFVVVGRGARWGINIIDQTKDTDKFIKPVKYYEDYVVRLRDSMSSVLRDIGLYEEWMKIHYKNAFSNRPFLSLRNIEHSLCEFRKYLRLLSGKGRKRIYRFKGNDKILSLN